MTHSGERVHYLLPTHVARVRDSIFVHLSDPECLDLTRGFFKQSIPEDRPVDRFMRLEDWLASLPTKTGREEFTNTSGIFHLARCGSTLLAQNLKATGQCIVLGEPRFIGQLIHNLEGTMDHQLYVCALQAIVGAWQDWAAQQNRHLVIKFSSLAYRNLEDLFDHLPGSRFLFLFREPAAVLESLTRSPPTYITRGDSGGSVSGLPEFAGRAGEGLAYHAAESFCSVLDRFGRATNERLACAEYDNLKEQFSAILKHFGLDAGAPGVRWSDDTYAKWKGDAPTRYEPTPPQQIENFARDHEELVAIARHYHASYREFAKGRGLLR